MDNRTFQRYDKWMGHYSAWVRDGFSKPGLYPSSIWPDGKPVGESQRVSGRKKQKRLLPIANPKETRSGAVRQPYIMPVEDDFWLTHHAIVHMPDDYKKFIILAWIRRYTDIRDLKVLLDMPSKQIRRWKVKVFDKLPL